MRKALIAFLILVLSGCATTPRPIVYNCPKIVLPPDPVPEVYKLTVKSKPGDIVKAWVATAIQYHDWNLAVHKEISEAQGSL